MGRLTTNVGLISGFPITDTVDQLIALQAKPRDALKTKTTQLGSVQSAVTELATVLTSLQIAAEKTKSAQLYSQRTISSSNSTALSATLTGVAGQPGVGSYQFTALQRAQTQQLSSSKFASNTAPLGAGTFSFRFGGFIDESASLDTLSGGGGVPRGKIRITDRSGASAEIDLGLAKTVDDVLKTISNNSNVRVTAQAVGDRIRLIDDTGSTSANLKVEEVAGGTTAAALGLSGINVAASSATGSDIVSLFRDLSLSRLNAGLGVRFDEAQADLKFTFRDNTEATLDLHKLAIPGTKASAKTNASSANAQVIFTATQAGAASTGVSITFVNDSNLQKGQETVSYSAVSKTLVFQIREGQTTADSLIAALQRDPAASAAFTATRATSNGNGLVSVSDSTVTAGHKSKATSLATLGASSQISFTAVQGGPSLDNVSIEFVDNGGIVAGSETVTFDDSNPLNKKLVFQIDAGATTANQVIAALNNNATASQYFLATRPTGSNGTGLVSVADGVTTAGGAIIEPVPGTEEVTLGAVLDAINALAPTKLKAQIAADGDRIELVDLSVDAGGAFAITQLGDSKVADDLGLTAATGDTMTGGRLLGGLQSSLLRNLDGGAGLDDLGLLSITDRSGATANVDLSNLETLDEVIQAINGAGLAIEAKINTARNGLTITDTSGQTSSNLIIANGDPTTTTAERLGLVVDAAVTEKNGGSLDLQVINLQTKLSKLNGGDGIPQGTFTITDTSGQSRIVSVNGSIQTVGDLIDQINGTGLGILAQLNDAGDGIAIVDTLHGSGDLKVTEGNRTTGAALRLLGASVTKTIGGVPTKVVEGSTTYSVTLSATDSLQDLVQKINAQGTKFTAAIVNDGSPVKPYRFTLSSQISGLAGQLLVDTSGVSFSLEETVKGQDALLLYGPTGSTGILASSSTNTFRDLLGGATLDLRQVSADPITLTVGASDSNLVANIQSVVDIFNRVKTSLATSTKYDSEKDVRGLLQGEGAALRVDTDLARLVSGRFTGVGSFQSLEALGITLKDDGTLEFDATKLRAKFAESPDSVRDFFAKDEVGFSDKLKKLTMQLSSGDNSLLANRVKSLDRRIASNNDRIEFYTARLERSRERLLLSFQRMEIAIAKIQSNQAALNQIAALSSALASNSSK